MPSDATALEAMAPVDQKQFRGGMALLAAAVNLVTTDGPAGQGGFTASAVTSVTDDPATLLVCVRRNGSATPVVRANGVVCVNTLAAGQQALSTAFGSSSGTLADRFALGEWARLVTGAPVLRGAVVNFDCRIAQVTEVGTHSVLFCQVLAVETLPEAAPLLYFNRAYRTV
ncbi:FMN reductase [Roseomonas stagni]|uniref:FMN reductase n=1 Tax=Falsiroseomonas algicola TaxID=2716930 RepID=A0A6M1LMN2_9PROT|nr:flavin reductase family protein [Falsiroseomonas algicola]NGM21621.1 FMN reductase [Falsiroseomonas algicola]